MEQEITQGFIKAMLFVDKSCIESDDFWTDDSQHQIEEGMANGSIPIDSDDDDLDAESISDIEKLVSDFVNKAGSILNDLDHAKVGHDLYFTRAGHGGGFWEQGRWPDDVGQKLDEICGQGEVSSYAYQDSGGFKISVYVG